MPLKDDNFGIDSRFRKYLECEVHNFADFGLCPAGTRGWHLGGSLGDLDGWPP
jgi:hypothetical protein